jgi:uncharacterized membrane protein HdeD (DUF308 family)
MDLLNTAWKLVLLRGIIGVLIGLLAIIWTPATVVALAVLWGIWALVDGIGLFTMAFGGGGTTGPRLVAAGMAVIAVLAGLYAIVHPGDAAKVLTWVLGIWLLVRGVFELFEAFGRGLPTSSRVWSVVIALIDFVLGGILVAHPGRSAVGIVTLLGVVALIWGVVLIALALVVRNQVRHLEDDGASPAPA